MKNKSPIEHGRQDKLLFMGNPHETVPRLLLLARDLSPREKFTWQFLRLSTQGTNSGLFPSYDQLQCWLSDYPDHEKASRSTVSHVLILLRLTRWLCLRERLRDAKTGQFVGNVYALYDFPPSLKEISHLDEEYLPLLTSSTKHHNRRIRIIATTLLLTSGSELTVDRAPFCTGCAIETGGIFPRSSVKTQPGPEKGTGDAPGPGVPSDRRPVHTTALYIKEKSTEGLRWPVDNPFSLSERRVAEQAMQDLDTTLCQQVLNDVLRRIASGEVRRPLAYLLATLARARRGEFNRLRKSVVKGRHQ